MGRGVEQVIEKSYFLALIRSKPTQYKKALCFATPVTTSKNIKSSYCANNRCQLRDVRSNMWQKHSSSSSYCSKKKKKKPTQKSPQSAGSVSPKIKMKFHSAGAKVSVFS